MYSGRANDFAAGLLIYAAIRDKTAYAFSATSPMKKRTKLRLSP